MFFSTYATAIVVYNFSTFARGHAPLYDGTRSVIDSHGSIVHTLRIMYYERVKHYESILNLTGASGSTGYCIPCNKSYYRVEDQRCSNKCYKCMTMPHCDMSGNLKTCKLFFRSFFGDSCYENHFKKSSFNKTTSVCDKIKICQICFRTIRLTSSRKHECGVSFYRTCKLYMPNGHLCYIQTIQIKDQTKNTSMYLFYDFETQQTIEILGDDEKKIHVPNLCIVQQVCSFCVEITDITVRCDHCGIREYVFQNNPVKQLVEFVLAPRQQFKKIMCIAHNSQGFDAQFVFKYIVE